MEDRKEAVKRETVGGTPVEKLDEMSGNATEGELQGGKSRGTGGVSRKNGDKSGKSAKKGAKKRKNETSATVGRSDGRQRDEHGRFVKGHGLWKGTGFAKGNAESLKYKDEYADMIIDYFGGPMTSVEFLEEYDGNGKVTKRRPMVIVNDFPTFEAFAAKIGVVTNTLRSWCEKDERFRFAYEMAKEMQLGKIKSGAMTGRYNPLFAKFEAVNNHGMSDKQEVEFGTRVIGLPGDADEEAN